jgi:hypothetical protein
MSLIAFQLERGAPPFRMLRDYIDAVICRGFTSVGLRMNVSAQRQLYLDLEALTEDQIEVGLEAGVWGDPARPVVQRYLDQMKLRRVEAALAEQLEAARAAIDAAQIAADEAREAKLRATAAFILAAGAMLAAMASAFVAFLALRNWTW